MHALTPQAEAAHAFLAPSSAHRWVFCPGSARLEALFPETEASPKSAAGTAAHWVFQCLFEGWLPVIDQVAPNGVPINAEMLEAGQMVYDDVVATLGPDWRKLIVVERRVHIPRVHESVNWGTPDVRGWGLLPDGRWILYIWDFKFGYKIVEVFENWQMIDYVSGCISETNLDGLTEQNVVVQMTVIQPRAYHRDGPIRRWTVKATDLRGHVNRLAASAEAATSADPKCYPEPSACEDCRGRNACEANQRMGYRAAEIGYSAQPLELTPEALGIELRMVKRAKEFLEARESGLEEHAVSLIKRGQPVAWFAMESTPGRKAWTRPVQEVLMLGQMCGKDFAKPVEAITPTQAAKLAPALATTIAAFSAAPVGSTKLVPDDGSKARRVFGSRPP